MQEDHKIIDFTKKRKERLKARRRQVERIMFRDFVGAKAVFRDADKIIPIEFINLSHKGVLIQLNRKLSYIPEAELKFQVYFTTRSYINVCINLKYEQEYVENGKVYWRYGGEFDNTTAAFKVLRQFIDFMYTFAEFSKEERKLKKRK